MPHFISWAIFGGILLTWLSQSGIINQLMMALGLLDKPILYNGDPKKFWWIAFLSDTLKEMGWSAIIYLAAISGIDPGLYEAAELDGAGRWSKMWNITIQCIRPTIALLFILGTSLMIYRHVAFDVPWLPGEYRQVWSVEAKVEFDAADQPVIASLALPAI